MDRSELEALLGRVMEATGQDQSLHAAVYDALRDAVGMQWFGDPTESVDAALAWVERVLPGWEMERTVTDTGIFVRLVGPEYIRYEFMGERNPHKSGSVAVKDRHGPIRPDALAILAALLKTLIAQSHPAEPLKHMPA